MNVNHPSQNVTRNASICLEASNAIVQEDISLNHQLHAALTVCIIHECFSSMICFIWLSCIPSFLWHTFMLAFVIQYSVATVNANKLYSCLSAILVGEIFRRILILFCIGLLLYGN